MQDRWEEDKLTGRPGNGTNQSFKKTAGNPFEAQLITR
jgi:hypothetical protein